MTWAFRRQFFYIIILILFLALCGYAVSYPSLHKAPSCVDGKQNGTETGIDCGGSCAMACLAQTDPISVLWARAFQVVPGRYNAVAYLQNSNKNIAVEKISYRFRFADANNLYIGKREGTTFVPPSGKFAVFEPAIDIGNSIPVYTTFEFTSVPQWITVPQAKIDQLQVLVSNIAFSGQDTSPLLTATVKNNSFYTVPGVDVVAIVYDADHNAISASRTYIDTLAPQGSSDVTFTWPQPFHSTVVAKEILPLYNIFSVTLQ